MTRITPTLLNDTLSLIQLARETARLQGQDAQVERLSPVVEGLKNAVSEAREIKASAPMMGQDGFRSMMTAVEASGKPASTARFSSPTDRSKMVLMMAEGGMTEIEIARHLGITRDDVQLVLSLQPGHSFRTTESKR